MIDDKIYTGGRDDRLFIWKGAVGGPEGFTLSQDQAPIALPSSINSFCYEPATKWLFCGLWNGQIKAYCKDPFGEELLAGHRRLVHSVLVHSGVLISGSADSTVRLWGLSPGTGWRQQAEPLQNPSGPVSSMRIFNDSLWVGAQSGITCFDLNTLQPKGTISHPAGVTGMVELQGYMLAAFRNGEVKIFDGAGNETYMHPPRGEHNTNTAVELMMHPVANKPMLLCGQQFGFITAYDLPDFRPRGS